MRSRPPRRKLAQYQESDLSRQRVLPPGFDWDPASLQPLLQVHWSLCVAMGHVLSSYSTVTKLKSVNISPDGMLGGSGYVRSLPEIRQQLAAVLEILSGVTDTLYDETRAPHWMEMVEEELVPQQEEVEELIEEADSAQEDPEGYALEVAPLPGEE
jgi:hypothetical protein